MTPQDEYKLYVGNLPSELDKDGLENIFRNYGKINGLMAPRNAGFAFVSYSTFKEAEHAIRDLHRVPPLNLNVQFSKDNKKNAKTDCVQLIRETNAANENVEDYDFRYKETFITTGANKAIEMGKPKNLPATNTYGTLHPVDQDPYLMNPFENDEAFRETNLLYTRGTVTVTRDGRRHVSLGRGYTFYNIAEPHVRIAECIDNVFDKRQKGVFIHGTDALKNITRNCHKCSTPTTCRCERCGEFYCSRECQINDWYKHKLECRQMPGLLDTPRTEVDSVIEKTMPKKEFANTQSETTSLRRPRASLSTRDNFETNNHNNVNVTLKNQKSFVAEEEITFTQPSKGLRKPGTNKPTDLETEESIVFQTDTYLAKDTFTPVSVMRTLCNGEYWIQKVDDQDKLADMLSKLQAKADELTPVAPIPGNRYAINILGFWQRVSLISFNPMKVLLIDFGNERIVETKDFRRLGEFENLPNFARHIRIVNGSNNEIDEDSTISVKLDSTDSDGVLAVQIQAKPQPKKEIPPAIIKETNSGGAGRTPPPEPKKPERTNSIASNKESVTLKAMKIPSILALLKVGSTGFYVINEEMRKNLFAMTIIADEASEDFQKVLEQLGEACNEVEKKGESYSPVLGDFVCCKRDSDWLRGYVSVIEPELKVTLFDEALIIKPKSCIPTPKDYINIQSFAAILECSQTDLKTGFFEVVDNADGRIKINITDETQKDIGHGFVEKWLPVPEQVKIKAVSLKSGSEVFITDFTSQNLLYVRSLDPAEKERAHRLDQDLAKYAQTAPKLGSIPAVGEMVVAPFIDDNLYRGMVLKIVGQNALIRYIDYGNTDNVAIDKLQVLSEVLKTQQSCVTKVILKDVIADCPLNEEAADYLQDLVGNSTPLKCTFEGIPAQDGVNLYTGRNENVNEKLNTLLKPNWQKPNPESDKECLMYDDMESLELGNEGDVVTVIVLTEYKPGLEYMMCIQDIEAITHIHDVMPKLINDYVQTAEHYIPRANELCLAEYSGAYYRAVCLDPSASPTSCNVLFYDFGNMEEVQHKNVRLMTKDFMTPGALGVICSVTGLLPKEGAKNTSQVMKRIKELVPVNEMVKAKIVSKTSGGDYVLDLPEIRETLVSEGLL